MLVRTLRFESRYRKHVHAVGSPVRRARKSNDDCQRLRRVSARFGDAPLNVKQMLRGGLLLVDSELDFDRRPFAVRHFDYGVDLPVAVVLVMVNRGVKRLCVAQEVAQHKALEEETKGVQVAFKPRRSRLEKCGSDGRIAEAALFGLLYARTGTEGWGKRANVLCHEESFKGVEVGGDGPFVDHNPFACGYVAPNGRDVYGCGFVPGEGSQQEFHFVPVSLDVVQLGEVSVEKPLRVRNRNLHCRPEWKPETARPSAAKDKFDYFTKFRASCGNDADVVAFADGFERDFPFARAAFPEAHRAHAETGDATGAGMQYALFRRRGRTGQALTSGNEMWRLPFLTLTLTTRFKEPR